MTCCPLPRAPWIALALLAAVACSDESTLPTDVDQDFAIECTIPETEFFIGASLDGIPALTDPQLVPIIDPGTAHLFDYLKDDDRVVSLELSGLAVAVPLRILWHHEIVNLDLAGESVAITHCPLTGSSLVFDRTPLNGVEFGVSGLLYLTNLVLYDRTDEDSLWPQMERGARCGPSTGTELTMLPAMEMRWSEFRRLYPENGFVVPDSLGAASSPPDGEDFDYRYFPYGPDCRKSDNRGIFNAIPNGIDPRRPPKELVLGVPGGVGGIAFPFGELQDLGANAVVEAPSVEAVVFWDAEAEAAMAYRPTLDGERLTFRSSETGITDEATGSLWSITGEAVAGPLKGRRLSPVAEAHTAYWYAWAAFHPSTTLWSG